MENSKKPEDFTFEEWQELYRKNPEKFEEMREEAITNLLNSFSDKNRESLRKFQWRIDMERKRCKNPLQSCIKMNEMLMKHFYSETGLYSILEKLSEKAEEIRTKEGQEKLKRCKIITLKDFS